MVLFVYFYMIYNRVLKGKCNESYCKNGDGDLIIDMKIVMKDYSSN